MREYELALVVSPDGGEAGFPATVERVHKFISDHGGSVNSADAWGRRRLAYQINRYSEGYYNITHFAIDPTDLRALEGSLDLADDVLRHLVVRLDEAMPPLAPRETAATPTAAPATESAPAGPAPAEASTESAPAEPAAAESAAESAKPEPAPAVASTEPEAAGSASAESAAESEAPEPAAAEAAKE